jgi:hypothetical protein
VQAGSFVTDTVAGRPAARVATRPPELLPAAPARYLPYGAQLLDVATGELLAWFPHLVRNRHAHRLARHAEHDARLYGAPAGAGGQEAGARPEGGSSRQHAKYAATPGQGRVAPLPPGTVPRLLRRHVRYAQRELLWRMSGLSRVRNCGRAPIVKGDRVAVRLRGEVAHYSGVQTCGSVHACPVCQGKVLNERAKEASAAAGGWMAAGNTVLLVGFTMPHDAPDRLADTLDVVAGGFRYITGHRSWRQARAAARVAGNVRALEHTHWLNGWHPHLHVLYFARGQLGATELARLAVTLRQLWGDYVESRGYRRPDVLHGVDVQVCHHAAEAGLYVAKTDEGRSVGNELARGDLKRGRRGHRAPLQLLEDFRQDADVADLALWREYERATRGRQRLTWSPRLRGLLAAEGVELAPARSDEEVAAAEVGGRVVLLVEPDSWQRLTRVPGLAGQLLGVVERQGVAAAGELLAGHGCAWALPPEDARPP